MSMTVLSAETLRATHVDSFADFASQVPGLSYTDSGPGAKRYALRGLQSAGEPEVALYYDEIPISGLPGGSLDTGDNQPDFKLWDVERIEVLRGPQGTLYGNGSMGGAIRIISKRPVLDQYQAAAETSVAATKGGSQSWRLNGLVNLPIVADKLAVRVMGYYRHEGGWIDDARTPGIALPQLGGDNLNWEHTWGGRAAISFQPTAHWNLTAIAYYQDLRTGEASDLYPKFAGEDRYVLKTFVHTPWDETAQMYNLISTTDLGWADLTATGSYQRRKIDKTVDTTRFLLSQFGCSDAAWGKTCTTPALVPAVADSRESVEAWSGEARLASKTPGPLEWTLGAFIQDNKTSRRSQVAKADARGYGQYDPTTGDAINRLFERDNFDTFDQYAVFGEGSYALTQRLKASIGLRWFHSDRTDQQVVVQQFFPGQPTGPQLPQAFKQGKLFQKYELSYSLNGQGLVYAQAAQGFRSGGANYPGGFNVTAPPFAADSVWDYEAGWKLNLAAKRLYWSGAVFRIDWSNLQQLVPTALFSYIANAGKARSDGFETEVSYAATSNLTLSGGLTYNDARLVGPQPAQTNPALQLKAGDKLANVPDWTAKAGVAYERPVGEGLTASARLDGAFQSGRANLVTHNTPAYFKTKSYTLVDLHAALASDRGWRLGLDVDNLLDRYAPLSAKALDSNLALTVAAARPRTVSLSVRVDY